MIDRIRRWLGIKGRQAQGWKYATTKEDANEWEEDEWGSDMLLPLKSPGLPGNWELVSVDTAERSPFVVFWWKAPADPGAPPAPEALSEKLDRILFALADARLKKQR